MESTASLGCSIAILVIFVGMLVWFLDGIRVQLVRMNKHLEGIVRIIALINHIDARKANVNDEEV